MKKTVWLCRDNDYDDYDDDSAAYRLHLLEPEWCSAPRGWLSSGASIYICQRAAKSFLGKDTLSPGQCVEVNCTPGTVWETS